VGLACVGLAKAVFGVGTRAGVWLAAACAAVSVGTAVGCLAGTRLGAQLPAASSNEASGGTLSAHLSAIAPPFDAQHWGEVARLACAGALLAVSGLAVWPAAVSRKAQRAQSGGLLGLLVAGVAQLAALALCAATPYCISGAGGGWSGTPAVAVGVD
jgi:hypothetical protein